MNASALSSIFKSRKGLAAVIVTLFVVAMFVAECVAAALGKMTFVALKSAPAHATSAAGDTALFCAASSCAVPRM